MSFRVGRRVVLNNGGKTDECNRTCVSILTFLAIISIPCFVYIAESKKYEMGRAFFEATQIIEELPDDKVVVPSLDNKLVHFSSSNIETTEILHDPDFGIESTKASKLNRQTEFCQWIEYFNDVKKDNGQTERTYYYVKEWRSYTIISAFFDQPFAHNNPQRNPTPSYSIAANTLKTGAFTVTKPLLESLPITSALHPSDTTLSHGFYDSLAFREFGFKYIGNGYFYSPYQASTEHMIFKLAGEYFEGSLFDFQIGDLFSQCTAGDIRVRFDVAIPTEVSVIGKQVGDKIVPYITTHDFSLALMHHGIKSSQKMFESEMSQQQWIVFLSRVVLLLWSIPVVFIGLKIEQTGSMLLGALFMTGIIVGSVWVVVWGTFTSLLLALISGAGLWCVKITSPPKNLVPPKM